MLPRSLRAHVLALLTAAAVAVTASATLDPEQAVAGPQAAASPATSSAPPSVTSPTAAPAAAPAGRATDPLRTRALFVDDRMPAVLEGESRHAPIAKKAQALWLGIDYYPTDRVRGIVQEYVGRAAAARRTPVLVAYSIPDRDCGQHSSGGAADAAAYKAWIKEVAAGIGSTKPMVVVEPDAIPFIGSPGCADADEHLALLRFAVKRLAAAGAWVYLDAGHSAWPADGRALLLKRAGVGLARGFATNVSNFRSLADELAYGALLRKELRALGVTGVKQVVDTSRNGAKQPVTGDVINPTWARVGKAPTMVLAGGLDATLWVKHPGESDGAVNGGAAAGRWCDLLADRLLGLPETSGC
ncbi:glycoside hydrolase family 6 protein [Nocardioides sp. SOB77]|uniref:Glucanase n=1 Tax=Nocardioides oceani TaxID=3058369 RepID=A0ABT8FCC7_9ACTN|nr:glycoside hydrolase family 6 protein [Nocardioides oceani]MDN4172333.1 glycoside hydrolase family 6 protein [Nocardioides oceani]